MLAGINPCLPTIFILYLIISSAFCVSCADGVAPPSNKSLLLSAIIFRSIVESPNSSLRTLISFISGDDNANSNNV